MAELIFRATTQYAGMAHWPLRLLEPGSTLPETAPKVRMPERLRAVGDPPSPASRGIDSIPIAYEPALIGNPEALIAGFAQNLAHYLGAAVGEVSPGGPQNWAQATEVLAVFMGFGLMFANTAFNFQARSCGSCGGPAAQRQAYLSQLRHHLRPGPVLRARGDPQPGSAAPSQETPARLFQTLREGYRRTARGSCRAAVHGLMGSPIRAIGRSGRARADPEADEGDSDYRQ